MFKKLNGSMLGSYSGFLIITACLAITACTSAAFADGDEIVKKLIGKWEGEIAIKNGFRTLVIESVKREGDQWTATGRYGTTGKNLGKMIIKVTVNGNDVSIEFTTGADNPAQLKLVGDRELDGSLRVLSRKKLVNADMKLKKVE